MKKEDNNFIPEVIGQIITTPYMYDVDEIALLESTKDNNACYTEAIVTFIDILGFKSMVESFPANKIASILSVFQYVSKTHSKATIINKAEGTKNIKKPPQVIYFSDSLVRIAYPMNFHGSDPRNEDIYRSIDIENEINDIAYFQRLLLLEGILIRGGITVGKIYSDAQVRIIIWCCNE